jgi:hypothetical protein
MYEIVETESPRQDLHSLRLTTGEFSGTVFHFGTVRILEDEDEDRATLQFDFEIETPCEGYEKDDLEKNEDFQNELGGVLFTIFEEHAEINEEKVGIDGSPSSPSQEDGGEEETRVTVDENV